MLVCTLPLILVLLVSFRLFVILASMSKKYHIGPSMTLQSLRKPPKLFQHLPPAKPGV